MEYVDGWDLVLRVTSSLAAILLVTMIAFMVQLYMNAGGRRDE